MATIYTRAGKGSALTWTEADANINNLNTAKLENVVEDTTPQLGGNLDVNGQSIVSTANANITIAPNGTGDVILSADTVQVGDANANATITTNGTGDLILSTNSGTNSGVITIQDGLNNDITVVPAGTGKVHFETSETRVGINNTNAKITTKGTGDLTLDTNSGTNSGSIVIADGVNGNISIVPNGSGNISLTPATGKIILGALDFPTGMGTNGQVLTTNGSTAATWTTVSGGGLTDVVNDTTPQLGGNLDLNTYKIVTASGNMNLEPAAGSNANITTMSAGNITMATATGNISLSPASGKIVLGALDWPTSTGSNGQVLTTNGSTATSWTTPAAAFVPASPGPIGGTTKAAGTFTTMTADVAVLDEIRETIYALTYGATITPDAANGSVQKVTLTGGVTFSAFNNPVAGQSITLIITQDATGSRTLTSTMLFAGGSKTLSTANSAVDIITVFFDGTTYYASLAKGFV